MVVLQAAQDLTGDASTVAWACFIVGLALVVLGTLIGTIRSFWTPTKGNADQKADEVKTKIEELKEGAEANTAQADAESTAEQAKKGVEQLQGIISALPEHLRFAGLLILVGALLMSVGTIQFGGISIF